MGVYRLQTRPKASPERAFDPWTDLERIVAGGSYRGSFQGELNAFARLAKREPWLNYT